MIHIEFCIGHLIILKYVASDLQREFVWASFVSRYQTMIKFMWSLLILLGQEAWD